MNTKIRNGCIMVFAGAVCWSLNAPLVKFINLDPFLVCGIRALIAGLFLLPFIRLKKLKFNKWIALYILGYGLLSLTIIRCLGVTSATVSIGMQYTSIIWIAVLDIIIKKQFNIKTVGAVSLVSLGILFFMWSGITNGTMEGNLLALTEGVYFSIITISSPKAAGDNPMGLTCLASLVTGVLVLLLGDNTMANITAMNTLDWVIILILGTLQLGLGYGLVNLGLKHISAQTGAILCLWEMILGPTWVAIFLKEYPSLGECMGLVVIFAGMLIYTLANKKAAINPNRKKS